MKLAEIMGTEYKELKELILEMENLKDVDTALQNQIRVRNRVLSLLSEASFAKKSLGIKVEQRADGVLSEKEGKLTEKDKERVCHADPEYVKLVTDLYQISSKCLFLEGLLGTLQDRLAVIIQLSTREKLILNPEKTK